MRRIAIEPALDLAVREGDLKRLRLRQSRKLLAGRLGGAGRGQRERKGRERGDRD
jgi:hypothetical protein